MPPITAKCTPNQLMMCIKHRTIMAKNKMQGGVRKFLPNQSFQGPEFLPPLPFFLSKETITCRRRRCQRGRRCRRFRAWGRFRRLGFGRSGWPWSGKKPWRFSMAWRTCSLAFTEKRCFFVFLFKRSKTWKINEQIKKTAHDSCLLKHSAFFLGVTHRPHYASLRLFVTA